MLSFNGVGGDFPDVEFCDTSVIDPQTGESKRFYPWWVTFAEGKRFTVPRVAALNGQEAHFNVEELTTAGRTLLDTYQTSYKNAQDFGRKSFDKIVKREAMSFPKAVMAARTVNFVLAHLGVTDSSGKIIQIQRHEILVSGYRIDGIRKAVGYFNDQKAGQTENDGGVEFLAREAGVSLDLAETLCGEDGRFVCYPTALAIARALLRNRTAFGLDNQADEKTLIRLGPPPSAQYKRLDLKPSVPETDDPNFYYRSAQCPHPENPFMWAA